MTKTVIHKVRPRSAIRRSLSMGLLLALPFANSAQAAVCEYVVSNEWNSGFVANIRITNDSTQTINGWTVNWSYSGDNRRSSGWNANVTGANPYSASNLSWNADIAPGQSVEFGMQGTKGSSAAEQVAVTGEVCGATPPPPPMGTDITPFIQINGGPLSETNTATVDVGDSVTLAPQPDDPGSWSWSGPNNFSANTRAVSITNIQSNQAGDYVAEFTNADNAVSTETFAIATSTTPPPPPGDGVFRVDTNGNITKNGTIMPVQCGSWFGLEGQHEPPDAANNADGAPMELNVGNMWWADTGRTIQQTMNDITAQGINVVRLPIAPQTLDPTDPQGIGDIQAGGVLKNHPSVRQTNARQAMTDFIVQAEANGIDVIIDIHSCSNYVGWRAGRLDATPPYVDRDRIDYVYQREGYSCGAAGGGVVVHEYNEAIWLDNLREIAGLSAELGVSNILGIDIFNEPWDYTWQEWKTLSEKAYQAINEVNQDVLIVVEGIGSGLSDGTQVNHGDLETNPNWGENFFSQGSDPLNIPKERLVLSPHTYGPSVFVQPMFMDPAQPQCEGLEGDEAGEADCNIVIDPARLRPGWEEHFGYLKEQGYAIIIGEFGGNFDWPALGTSQGVRDLWSHVPPGVDGEWQNTFVDYMIEKKIQGCYWSINPESGDTGGLYIHSYDPVSNTPGWGTWLGLDVTKWQLLDRLWGN